MARLGLTLSAVALTTLLGVYTLRTPATGNGERSAWQRLREAVKTTVVTVLVILVAMSILDAPLCAL